MKWWRKFKTWARIQWRIFLMEAANYFVVVERPLMILVNWAILLTSPIWVGLFYVVSTIMRAWASKKNVERRVLTGEIWYWNSFKLY